MKMAPPFQNSTLSMTDNSNLIYSSSDALQDPPTNSEIATIKKLSLKKHRVQSSRMLIKEGIN